MGRVIGRSTTAYSSECSSNVLGGFFRITTKQTLTRKPIVVEDEALEVRQMPYLRRNRACRRVRRN